MILFRVKLHISNSNIQYPLYFNCILGTGLVNGNLLLVLSKLKYNSSLNDFIVLADYQNTKFMYVYILQFSGRVK